FDFAGAQTDLQKAVALNPGDANVLHRFAILNAVVGELPTAIATERRAFALDPLSEEICRRLAFFLVANGQMAAARPLFERSLALAQNSARAHFSLGELELLEKRPNEALAQFRQTSLESLSLAGQAAAEYSLGHLDASDRAMTQLIAK